jgi:hypothetical protein
MLIPGAHITNLTVMPLTLGTATATTMGPVTAVPAKATMMRT